MGFLLVLSHHGLESGFLMKETLKFEIFVLCACMLPWNCSFKKFALGAVNYYTVVFSKCLLLTSTCKKI